MSREPDPDCDYCHGEGEYFTHADDCDDDGCALALGIWDCNGQVVPCSCTFDPVGLPRASRARVVIPESELPF